VANLFERKKLERIYTQFDLNDHIFSDYNFCWSFDRKQSTYSALYFYMTEPSNKVDVIQLHDYDDRDHDWARLLFEQMLPM
jgi:hypothetical protein